METSLRHSLPGMDLMWLSLTVLPELEKGWKQLKCPSKGDWFNDYGTSVQWNIVGSLKRLRQLYSSTDMNNLQDTLFNEESKVQTMMESATM